MTGENEELAMIEAVGVGARDVGHPILWFTVTGEGWAALQVRELDSDDAKELLGAVYEARELNGRVCVIEKSGQFGGTVTYKRLLSRARTK